MLLSVNSVTAGNGFTLDSGYDAWFPSVRSKVRFCAKSCLASWPGRYLNVEGSI